VIGPALITVALAALVAGGLAGIMGAFLVLRGQGLLGDTLAHAALPGVVGAFLVFGARDLGVVLPGALLAGGLAALAVQGLTRRGLRGDGALAVVLSLFFAAGIVLLSLAQGRPGSAGLGAVLFGQAASVLRGDVALMAGVGAGLIAALALLWKEIALTVFDREGARVQGLPVARIEAGLTLAVALVIVLGLSLAGVVMIVALLVAPAVAARALTARLAAMVVTSGALGALAGGTGAVLSARAGIATGPVMVLVAFALALGALGWAAWRRARAQRPASAARVLGAMRAMAAAHDDPVYPCEEGMIAAGLGRPVRAGLAQLLAEGRIAPAAHDPETTPHWVLRGEGRDG
jgi:manganese/zinc/iron transport system permease protein